MNREEYAAWVQAAWVRDVMGKTPAAKAVRQLKTSNRESRKALRQAQRSYSAQQASTKRKLNTRLEQIEREFQGRREARDRELSEKQWALIVDSR